MDDGSEPNLRRGVRAVVLDHRDRVLLVRFDFRGRTIWATPGGGIEPDETPEDALRRELAEEAGLLDPKIGPRIWTRTHLFEMGTGHDGQRESFYLVRTEAFTVRPGLTRAQLEAEHVTDVRWWTLPELEGAEELFAPRDLPTLLRSLVDGGPPPAPVDVGV